MSLLDILTAPGGMANPNNVVNVGAMRTALAAGADPNEGAGGLLQEALRLLMNSTNDAAKDSLWEAVRLLLDHGADPTASPADTPGRMVSRVAGVGGNSPLGFAALQGRSDMVTELLRGGPGRVSVDINKKDRLGYTPIMWAVRSNNPLELISVLCKFDPAIDDGIYALVQRYQRDAETARRVSDALKTCQEYQIKTKGRGIAEVLAAPRESGYKPPVLPAGSRPPAAGPATASGIKPQPVGSATSPGEVIGKFLGLGGNRRKTIRRRRRHGKKRTTRKH